MINIVYDYKMDFILGLLNLLLESDQNQTNKRHVALSRTRKLKLTLKDLRKQFGPQQYILYAKRMGESKHQEYVNIYSIGICNYLFGTIRLTWFNTKVKQVLGTFELQKHLS